MWLLVNGGRGGVADPESRETFDGIGCGGGLNACQVYRQTGGHAYGSVYGGPIGAILTPQLISFARKDKRLLPIVATVKQRRE